MLNPQPTLRIVLDDAVGHLHSRTGVNVDAIFFVVLHRDIRKSGGGAILYQYGIGT